MVSTPVRPAAARTRPMAGLFAGAALMSAAMATASTVSTIMVADRLGTGWGGIANTAGVAGTGIGALLLTRLAARRGRAASLASGYLAATVGGAVAAVAVAAGDVAGLVVGMLLLGLGNAAAQLSRYAAADLHPADRRGRALGVIVWAGTLGAVGGPLLLAPAETLAQRLGWPGLTGPYAFALAATALAATAATWTAPRWVPGEPAPTPARGLLRAPSARGALAVMTTGQVVMVAVMTAAPLDMHRHGHGLGPIGLALSAHTLGMFALSPLTGRLVDRLGSGPVMVTGLVALVAACAAAASAPQDHAAARAAALFLLGYAWNLCFVGGSGALARDLPAGDRVRVEGTVDAAVWGAAAVASLGSTAVLAAGGYGLLAAGSGLLVLLPVVVLLGGRVGDRRQARRVE